MENDKESLKVIWDRVEVLLSSVLGKYKESFSLEEKEVCEELLEANEYGEAFENLVAIIDSRNLSLDTGSIRDLKEAANLMDLRY